MLAYLPRELVGKSALHFSDSPLPNENRQAYFRRVFASFLALDVKENLTGN